MGSREMDALIVRHLTDIEEAGKRLEVIDREGFKDTWRRSTEMDSQEEGLGR